MAIRAQFAIQVVALVAGETKSITPPRAAKAVTIFSEAAVDVALYTDPDSDDTILPIDPGWNQSIRLETTTFSEQTIAFWLKCSQVNAMVTFSFEATIMLQGSEHLRIVNKLALTSGSLWVSEITN